MRSPPEPHLHGPKKISDVRQIAIPKELMEDMGLKVGDPLFLLAWQGCILLLSEQSVIGELDRFTSALARMGLGKNR
jgi:bifunctional DNA-binding transcriptional regulator/antitoxin component of YhaV-PrlF toxin-antitoxin module